MTEEINVKLAKIKALMESATKIGSPAEAEAARKKLEALCTKHGIDISSISAEDTTKQGLPAHTYMIKVKHLTWQADLLNVIAEIMYHEDHSRPILVIAVKEDNKPLSKFYATCLDKGLLDVYIKRCRVMVAGIIFCYNKDYPSDGHKDFYFRGFVMGFYSSFKSSMKQACEDNPLLKLKSKTLPMRLSRDIMKRKQELVESYNKDGMLTLDMPSIEMKEITPDDKRAYTLGYLAGKTFFLKHRGPLLCN